MVDYDKIPNHRLSNGRLVNLRDFLDFRPVVGTKGSFDSGGPILIEQPKDGTLVTRLEAPTNVTEIRLESVRAQHSWLIVRTIEAMPCKEGRRTGDSEL